jgi:predicted nucleotidyltransferase
MKQIIECQITAKINELVSRIVKLVEPKKIILFGSAVRNEMHQDSDIDLLIVMSDGIHRRKTAQYLYQYIGSLGFPYDLIVATETDIDNAKFWRGFPIYDAVKEGKEVYIDS